MDVYIVDSNLIFSALLSSNNKIGQFILKASEYDVRLYAPNYLKGEIDKHYTKIIDRSKLTEEEVELAIDILYHKIQFLDDRILPFDSYVTAMRLVRDIDSNDVTFVALTKYMDKTLWTGDTQLYNGLKARGFTQVVNFNDLKSLYKL